MRVLICGGRTFDSPAQMWLVLDRLHAERKFTALIQGGNPGKDGKPGADRLAKEWARTKPEIERYESKADWKKHGLKAGPLRNAHMLEWKPDLVVAFPGGDGTADMVRRARKAGIEVIQVE